MVFRLIPLCLVFLFTFINEATSQRKLSGPAYKNATAKEKYSNHFNLTFDFNLLKKKNSKAIVSEKVKNNDRRRRRVVFGRHHRSPMPGLMGPSYKNHKIFHNNNEIQMHSLRALNQYGD